MTVRTNNPTKVPSVLTVPAGVSPELRRYLEQLTETIEIRLGRRGDQRDRAVTLRELIDSGLAKDLLSNPFDPNTSGNTGFVPPSQALQDLAVPPAPTGFTAVGAFSQVILNWDYPSYANHSFTEVWRHDSDSVGDAQLVGVQAGRVFVDPVGSGVTRYYWVRHVNTDNIFGPFNSASGTAATTATDVNHMLGVLSGAITSSQLATSLATPIGNLPANTASSITAIETAQNAQGVTIAAQASTVTSLNSTVAGHTTSISTQATSINGLSAQYSVKIDNNGHVSGFGLSSTTTTAGPTSAFIVRADTFAIVDPASTGNGLGTTSPTADTVPFIYHDGSGTLNGETVPAGVYMKRTFIGEAQIQNAQIKELAADKISSGFISSGRIQTNSIDASKLNIDNSSLTSSVVGGVPTLQIGAVNVNTLTGNSISATIMSGTTVYANRLTGDVNKLIPFRSTTPVPFRGNAASGGGTVVVLTEQLPATTHLTVGHKPFASVTGWYDSTNAKTYSFKLYMQLGSGSYQLVGETRFKANTNLYAQFAVSGSLSTATTSVVNLKLEVTRTGSSGIFYNDTSTTVDNIYEVSGFILGAR